MEDIFLHISVTGEAHPVDPFWQTFWPTCKMHLHCTSGSFSGYVECLSTYNCNLLIFLFLGRLFILKMVRPENGHAKQFTQHYFSSYWFQSVEGC